MSARQNQLWRTGRLHRRRAAAGAAALGQGAPGDEQRRSSVHWVTSRSLADARRGSLWATLERGGAQSPAQAAAAAAAGPYVGRRSSLAPGHAQVPPSTAFETSAGMSDRGPRGCHHPERSGHVLVRRDHALIQLQQPRLCFLATDAGELTAKFPRFLLDLHIVTTCARSTRFMCASKMTCDRTLPMGRSPLQSNLR